eukprot:12905959-Alexandrium_andersonii.AAC.1
MFLLAVVASSCPAIGLRLVQRPLRRVPAALLGGPRDGSPLDWTTGCGSYCWVAPKGQQLRDNTVSSVCSALPAL